MDFRSYTSNLKSRPKAKSTRPNSTPTANEMTTTSMVRRVACSLVGHTTLFSSPTVSRKNWRPGLRRADSEPADRLAGALATTTYLTSLWDLCWRQRGQYLESSIRCGSLRWFFTVV